MVHRKPLRAEGRLRPAACSPATGQLPSHPRDIQGHRRLPDGVGAGARARAPCPCPIMTQRRPGAAGLGPRLLCPELGGGGQRWERPGLLTLDQVPRAPETRFQVHPALPFPGGGLSTSCCLRDPPFLHLQGCGEGDKGKVLPDPLFLRP